jgi:hypothetical protein
VIAAGRDMGVDRIVVTHAQSLSGNIKRDYKAFGA